MPDTVTLRITSQGGDQAAGDVGKVNDAIEDLDRTIKDLNRTSTEHEQAADTVSSAAQSQESSMRSLLDTVVHFAAVHAIGIVALKGLEKGFHHLGPAAKRWLHGMRPLNGATEKFSELVETAHGGLGRFRKAGAAWTARMKSMTVVAVGFAGAIALAISNLALMRLAARAAHLAPMRRAFDNLAESTGHVSEALMTKLKEAVLYTVPEVDLLKSSVLALNSGAIQTSSELLFLAKAAQVLGQTVGFTTSQGLENLIRGIGLINPQLIKSVGVLVSAEEAYRRYAEQVGKTVVELTDHERHEAFRIAVMEELRAAIARVGDQEEDLNVLLQQTAASWKDARLEMSEVAAESSNVVGLYRDVQRAGAGIARLLSGPMRGAVRFLSETISGMGRLALTLTPFVNFFVILGRQYAKQEEKMRNWVIMMKEVGRQAQNTAYYIDQLGEAHYNLLQQTDKYDPGTLGIEFRSTEIDDALATLGLMEGAAEEAFHPLQEYLDDLPAGFAYSAENIAYLTDALRSAQEHSKELRLEQVLLRDTMERAADVGAEELEELRKKYSEIQAEVQEAERQVSIFTSLLGGQIRALSSRTGEWIENFTDLDTVIDDIAGRARTTLAQGFSDPILQGISNLQEYRELLQQLGLEAVELPEPPGLEPPEGSWRWAQDLLGGYQAAGIPPSMLSGEQRREAEEAGAILQEHETTMLEWNEIMGLSAQRTEHANAVMVSSMGAAAQAIILGSQNMAEAMIQAASQIGSVFAASRGFPVLGAAIGAVGGIIGSLFQREKQQELDRRRALQNVKVEEYGMRALDQMAGYQGPQTLTVQLIDPRTGEVTGEYQSAAYLLARGERRDAVKRY